MSEAKPDTTPNTARERKVGDAPLCDEMQALQSRAARLRPVDLHDAELDTADPYTRLFLLAEYWQRKCLEARAALAAPLVGVEVEPNPQDVHLGISVSGAQDGEALPAGTVTADFPIIAMGHGKIEVGDGQWEGLPVLWFGNDGQGIGFERQRGHAMPVQDRETLVMFTFANIEGLEAIEAAVSRVRSSMTGKPLGASATVAEPEGLEHIWTCKIGGRVQGIPKGADAPMRNAIADAFAAVTGHRYEFLFSNWAGELTEPERAVHENRLPSAEYEQQWMAKHAASEPTQDAIYAGGNCITPQVLAALIAEELHPDDVALRIWRAMGGGIPERGAGRQIAGDNAGPDVKEGAT